MLHVEGSTRRGNRTENQDMFVISDKGVIPAEQRDSFDFCAELDPEHPRAYAVLDGVGGGVVNGGFLSAVAGQAFALAFEEGAFQPSPEGSGTPLAWQLLQAAICAAKSVAQACGEQCGGTTLSCVAVYQKQFAFLGVGDSPAYIWHKNALEPLFVPQNEACRKQEEGMNIEKYDRCCLLSCLGADAEDAIEHFVCSTGTLEPGSSVILMTDGISLTSSSLRFALRHRWLGLGTAKRLAEFCARRKKSDNSTILIVREDKR